MPPQSSDNISNRYEQVRKCYRKAYWIFSVVGLIVVVAFVFYRSELKQLPPVQTILICLGILAGMSFLSWILMRKVLAPLSIFKCRKCNVYLTKFLRLQNLKKADRDVLKCPRCSAEFLDEQKAT